MTGIEGLIDQEATVRRQLEDLEKKNKANWKLINVLVNDKVDEK